MKITEKKQLRVNCIFIYQTKFTQQKRYYEKQILFLNSEFKGTPSIYF